MRNRIIGLLAAGLAVPVAGCGDVPETGYLALTQVSGIAVEEGGCAAPDKTLVPPLFYDAGAGDSWGDEYLLGLWLRNGLIANDETDTSIGRTNTNQVQVNKIVVEFTGRDRWGFLPESKEAGMPFTVDTEAEVGWPTRLLPLDVAHELVTNSASPIREPSDKMELLPIRIHAEGELMDGTAVKSNDFDLTLTVCNGCVPICPFGLKEGCSQAQPDLRTCQEPEETTGG